MNAIPNAPDDDLDRLLAEHLDRQSAEVEVDELRRRIEFTLSSEMPKPAPVEPTRRRPLLAWAVGSTAIAVLALVALLTGDARPLRAGPRALLEEAQKAHHLPLDRCYLIEIQRADGDEPAFPQRTQKLWTRGDRFWIETTGPRATWAWGRDENGTVWISPGPRRGLRIDPEEATRALTVQCEICELRPEHLLGTLLRDFDLKREDVEGSATQVIEATLKRGRRLPGPALRSAVIEIDPEAKVLRRVALTRTFFDRTITTTYTLVESKTMTDDRYRLEGHLTAPYEIFTADHQSQRRREILNVLFGPRAADWIRPTPATPKEGTK